MPLADVIDPGVLPVGRENPHRQADRERQDVRQQSENGGHRQRFLDDLVDRLVLVLGGIAEIGIGLPADSRASRFVS